MQVEQCLSHDQKVEIYALKIVPQATFVSQLELLLKCQVVQYLCIKRGKSKNFGRAFIHNYDCWLVGCFIDLWHTPQNRIAYLRIDSGPSN